MDTNRTAIITGGTRGLGLELAASLSEDGWTVVTDGRHAVALDEARNRLGPRAILLRGDVTDATHRAELVDAAVATGRLDLVVNNASTLGPSPLPRLERLDLDAFERILRTNVVAPLGLVQLALPHLRRTVGSVIDLTSDAGVEGYEGWGAYGSSKAALEQLSNVLAAEEPGLRVWWVDPGDLRTQMHQDAFPGEDISDRPLPATVVPAFRSILWDRPPSGRLRATDLLREPVTL